MQSSKIIASHVVQNITDHIRLQEYGVGIFDEIPTKSSLKKAIKHGRLLVNGKVATTALYVHIGDVIELLQVVEKKRKVYNISLKVYLEDDFLAIIEKPAGISVSGNKFSSIQNALEPHLYRSPKQDATNPHPVHRLDYATSGLLIIGKTATSRRILHQMFENRMVKKTYHAVTVGQMTPHKGIIESPLDGKEAITQYQVLDSVKSEKYRALNLAELNPLTGRMHQLRKHLLVIGNPIMGDQKYYLPNKRHKGYGLYLHASRLEFNHPISNDSIDIESLLPKKFIRLFPNCK